MFTFGLTMHPIRPFAIYDSEGHIYAEDCCESIVLDTIDHLNR